MCNYQKSTLHNCAIMPMSKTEADGVTSKFGVLREDFDSLKTLVETTNTSIADISTNLNLINTNLTKKIDDGNAKLCDRIERFETKFNDELNGLKAADDEIRQSLKETNEHTTKKLHDLEANVAAADTRNRDTQRQLDASNAIISSQAAQIIRLEK